MPLWSGHYKFTDTDFRTYKCVKNTALIYTIFLLRPLLHSAQETVILNSKLVLHFPMQLAI